MKTKKGTTEVDDAFLAEIERWRELLAKNIALRNPSLSVRELNYAVQMTIDRIVFLRICEDRGVERDEQLKEIASSTPSAPLRRGTSPKSAGEKIIRQESSADLGRLGGGLTLSLATRRIFGFKYCRKHHPLMLNITRKHIKPPAKATMIFM